MKPFESTVSSEGRNTPVWWGAFWCVKPSRRVTITHGNNGICVTVISVGTCITEMETRLTCVAGDSPEDARQAGQRSASPALVHLQHGCVLVLYMRRNDQILQIPLMDLWNFVQAEFLQQRVLHILVRKGVGAAEEDAAEDTSAEEIHESKRPCDKQQRSSTSHPRTDSVPLTLPRPLIPSRPSQSFALSQWGQGPLSEQRCDNTAPS